MTIYFYNNGANRDKTIVVAVKNFKVRYKVKYWGSRAPSLGNGVTRIELRINEKCDVGGEPRRSCEQTLAFNAHLKCLHTSAYSFEGNDFLVVTE